MGIFPRMFCVSNSLCDIEQVVSPLWDLVTPFVKWGLGDLTIFLDHSSPVVQWLYFLK